MRIVLTDRRGRSFRNLGSVTGTHLGSWHQILDAVLPHDLCMHSLGDGRSGDRGLPHLQDPGLAQNEACIRERGVGDNGEVPVVGVWQGDGRSGDRRSGA